MSCVNCFGVCFYYVGFACSLYCCVNSSLAILIESVFLLFLLFGSLFPNAFVCVVSLFYSVFVCIFECVQYSPSVFSLGFQCCSVFALYYMFLCFCVFVFLIFSGVSSYSPIS